MQPTTESPAQPQTSHGFAIGDAIKFVLVRSKGRSISMKTMEGTIAAFSKPTGNRALVKYHGGYLTWVDITDVAPTNQPSPLNKVVETLAK